jgi:hypothetical protein
MGAEMPRREYSTPPAISSAQAELVAVKEQLMEMDRALRAERVARSELSARSKAEISVLRRELEDVAPDEADRSKPFAKSSGGRLLLSGMAVALIAAIAGFSVWYVDPLHTWDDHPAVVSQSVRAESVKAAQTPPSSMGASSETHEFSRLNDAVRSVPVPSIPVVLNAANDWLGANGQQSCSVESPQGEVSLVISGRGGDKPLLSALSRCANAVEHLAKSGNQDHP